MLLHCNISINRIKHILMTKSKNERFRQLSSVWVDESVREKEIRIGKQKGSGKKIYYYQNENATKCDTTYRMREKERAKDAVKRRKWHRMKMTGKSSQQNFNNNIEKHVREPNVLDVLYSLWAIKFLVHWLYTLAGWYSRFAVFIVAAMNTNRTFTIILILRRSSASAQTHSHTSISSLCFVFTHYFFCNSSSSPPVDYSILLFNNSEVDARVYLYVLFLFHLAQSARIIVCVCLLCTFVWYAVDAGCIRCSFFAQFHFANATKTEQISRKFFDETIFHLWLPHLVL